jgi:hypothetical protein
MEEEERGGYIGGKLRALLIHPRKQLYFFCLIFSWHYSTFVYHSCHFIHSIMTIGPWTLPNGLPKSLWVPAGVPNTTYPAPPTPIPETGTGTICSAEFVPLTVADLSKVTPAAPIKRGRGRPRTRPLTPPLPEGVEPPPKRGRGRPRKHPLPGGAEPLPKRSRGRPPKVRSPEEVVEVAEETPQSQLRKNTIIETSNLPDQPRPGSSPPLEDLFPEIWPPLQNALPEASPPPPSLPPDATPPLESLHLEAWSPLQNRIIKAPPQPQSIPPDDPINWQDWLVDDLDDIDAFADIEGKCDQEDKEKSRADSFIELPLLSPPLQLPQVPPPYPGTSPSSEPPSTFEGPCPTRTAETSAVDSISPFHVLKRPEEATGGVYWSQLILSENNSQLQSKDILLRDLDEQSFNVTDITFWAIMYAKSTEGRHHPLKNCQEDILTGSEMWWQTHDGGSTTSLY